VDHRPGLDGLRGLAVIAVVAFHLGLLRGGFLGVDVFFTLSGYLITRLVAAETARGEFTLGRFWQRRLRRLLPALVVVVGVVALIVTLDPRSRALVGDVRTDALASLTYLANWHEIFGGTGYFERLAADPLGHTWSLAVEEQFYLLWPPLLWWALRRGGARRAAAVAGAGAAMSAGWMAIVAAQWGPDRAYFGTDTRLGAVMVGAVAALLVPEGVSSRRGQWTGAAALITLGCATALAVGSNPWLYRGGFALVALLSVFATAVAAGEGPVARGLSNPLLRWFGTRSYGIYLWHVPVIALVSTARTAVTGAPLRILQVALSLGLAEASYRWLEQPIRNRSLRWAKVAPGLAMISIIAVELALLAPRSAPPPSLTTDGWNPDPSAIAAAEERAAPSPTAPSTTAATLPPLSPPTTAAPQAPLTSTPAMSTTPTAPAVRMNPAPPPRRPRQPPRTTAPPALAATAPPPVKRILVVGDSVAVSLDAAFAQVSRPREIVNRGIISCNVWGDEPTRGAGNAAIQDPVACQGWRQRWPRQIRETGADGALLVLGTSGGTRWLDDQFRDPCEPIYDQRFAEHLGAAIDLLRSHARTVGVTTIAPLTGFVTAEVNEQVGCANRVIRDQVARRPDVRLVDLAALICPAGRCVDVHEGRVVRPDGLHYADDARWVARWLARQMGLRG
jgi:peptidoglycan/LPS O-acetylase OafA/YrhL